MNIKTKLLLMYFKNISLYIFMDMKPQTIYCIMFHEYQEGYT